MLLLFVTLHNITVIQLTNYDNLWSKLCLKGMEVWVGRECKSG